MDKQTFLNRFLVQRQTPNTELDGLTKSLVSKNHSFKQAAVLIPIVNRRNGLNIILTERALHLRHHPGQVSFPGGKYEDSDTSLRQTALRETHEEIGILQEQVSIFGTMPELSTISGFVVSPYIGFVTNNHKLKIDKQEVSNVFELPIDFLLNKNNTYLQPLFANKKRHATYCIPYNNKFIWGVTAQILINLQRQLAV